MNPPAMFLVLAGACTGTSSKPSGETAAPEETAESTADTDTGADSVTDTADTTDTTDTSGGDSEDTFPHTEWSPGDEVPGWDDADCTEQHSGRTYVITYPDIYMIQATFMSGMPAAGPHLFGVRLRDCAHFPCAADSLDDTVPYTLADLDATRGDDAQPRGIGEWGPDAEGPRQVVSHGRSALIDFANEAGSFTRASVTVCIERLRPDEIRGAVRAEVFERNFPYGAIGYYNSLVYRFPFSIRLADHAGFDATLPDDPADMPEGYATAHFVYEQPYDDAWPWDDITDPSIREQLYERYTPYNGL